MNIVEFCKAFNAKTSGKDQEGLIIPVVISIFSDRSFTFISKTPPVPILISGGIGPDAGDVAALVEQAGQMRVTGDASWVSEFIRVA